MTVNYDIGVPRKDGKMRISLILNIGKTKKRIHTDLLASRSDLNRKGRLRNDTPLYTKVRKAIDAKEKEYAALETFLTGERITASEAAQRMGRADIPSFFTYAGRWLGRADMKGRKNYSCAVNSFRAFLKGQDITFAMFSHKLLNDYCHSLKDTKRAQSLYLSAIKRIYDDAEKDYDITPFSKFRFDIPRQKASKHRALDTETLRKVLTYDAKRHRDILARDCCLLSFCLMATNAADLYNAPKIKNNILAYDRTKTKDRRHDNAHIEIVIPRQIRSLVRKYAGNTRAFRFSQDYASIDGFNHALNKGLSNIKDDLGIESLTFYSIRHSFATIARNEAGIDKATIHELLNHIDDDTAIDDIYIKKDFRLVNAANQKVVDYVLGERRF